MHSKLSNSKTDTHFAQLTIFRDTGSASIVFHVNSYIGISMSEVLQTLNVQSQSHCGDLFAPSHGRRALSLSVEWFKHYSQHSLAGLQLVYSSSIIIPSHLYDFMIFEKFIHLLALAKTPKEQSKYYHQSHTHI